MTLGTGSLRPSPAVAPPACQKGAAYGGEKLDKQTQLDKQASRQAGKQAAVHAEPSAFLHWWGAWHLTWGRPPQS